MFQKKYYNFFLWSLRFYIVFVFWCFFLVANSSASSNNLRVISLAPAITEIVYDLNAEDSLVGVSSYCDFPKDALTKVQVGGFLNPNLEKIIALSPDYVIVNKNSGTYAFSKKLKSLKIKILIVEFYNLDDIKDAYLKIGTLLNCKTKAIEKINLLDRRILFYKNKLKNRRKKLVSFLRWKIPLTVAAKNTLEDELISIVGGKNVVGLERTRYPIYSMESFLASNAEIIIDGSYYKSPNSDEMNNISSYWRKWNDLKAVKMGNVYILKSDFHSVPGARTIMFLDELAAIINPDLFKRNETLSEKVDIK